MLHRSVCQTFKSSKIHFKNPLREFEYEVLKSSEIPQNILKPKFLSSLTLASQEISSNGPQILTKYQIEKIKKSAKIASLTLTATENFLNHKANENLRKKTNGTVTCEDIDDFVFNFIIEQNAYPIQLGHKSFPKSVCVSVNECLVHGVPSMRPLFLGDKINIDVCVYYDGYCGDTNLTMIYGGVEKAPTIEVKSIVGLAQQALYRAIEVCGPGVKLNRIGEEIEQFSLENNVHICKHFTGHGIGRELHMPPTVHHLCNPSEQYTMVPGNVFTIEPILTTYCSNTELQTWGDKFTTISENNPNSQFEHMILITEEGFEVLTRRNGENVPISGGGSRRELTY